MSGVAILSPGYPQSLGGVTDHTHRLVSHWSTPEMPAHVLAETTAPPSEVIGALAASGIDALLIQYVPFLFGRRGVSSYPERLARTARAAGLRVTTFVHEPWVPPTRLPWLVLSPIQRRQLRRLIAVSDATVTAVPEWAAMLGPEVGVVYVGSTLGDAPPQATEPPLEAPTVFSPFAAGLRWDWIAAAAEAIAGPGHLTLIGAGYAEAATHHLLAPWADAQWDWRGRLPAPEVLGLLARAPLVLAPFVDGITGRRTSIMAALSSGARVVTSSGHLWDPFFAQGPIGIAATKDEFVRLARDAWARADPPSARTDRRTWYDATLAPNTLDDRLLRIVRGSGA